MQAIATAAGRNDTTCFLYAHSFAQSSVICRVEGASLMRPFLTRTTRQRARPVLFPVLSLCGMKGLKWQRARQFALPTPSSAHPYPLSLFGGLRPTPPALALFSGRPRRQRRRGHCLLGPRRLDQRPVARERPRARRRRRWLRRRGLCRGLPRHRQRRLLPVPHHRVHRLRCRGRSVAAVPGPCPALHPH